MAFIQGRTYFRQAIDVANRQGYMVEELDSMQDMAVLLMRAEQYDDAERYLKAIRSKIPEQYVIRLERGLVEIPVAERIDAFYKLLGQVELLEGAIVYARGARMARKRGVSMTGGATRGLIETRRYLLAVSYFSHYATENFVRGLTFGRIYKRFEGCDPALVREITQEHMPQWVEGYKLPEKLVRSLFQDVFGLFD